MKLRFLSFLLLVLTQPGHIFAYYYRYPLHEAAHKGDIETVKRLIESGVDVNASDLATKETALHFASQKGCAEIVKLLIAAGADVNLKNWDGYTPGDEALCASRDENLCATGTEVLQLLKNAGAILTISYKEGEPFYCFKAY